VAAEPGRLDRQPLRRRVAAERLLGGLERLALAVRLADPDPVTRLYGGRRDIRPDAVHGEVTMADPLAGPAPPGRAAHPGGAGVEPRLERAQEVLAGDAGRLLGPVEVVPELPLEDGVDAPHLLLLAKLDPEIAHLPAPHAVLAGWAGTPLEGALL